MNATAPTLWILRFHLRAMRRWLGAHGFEIFCLAPVIAGGVLWVLERQLSTLREPITAWLSHAEASTGPFLAFALLLVALALPATCRELYDPRRESRCLDPLPIPEIARFHAALAVELLRVLSSLVVLLLSAGFLAGDLLPPVPELAERGLRLGAALGVLTIGRLALAVGLMHSRWLARVGWLALGVLGLLALAVPEPVRSWLLLPWLAPAAQLQAVFAGAVGLDLSNTLANAPWLLGLTGLICYGLARFSFLAWHRRDLEVAARVGPKTRRSLLGFLSGSPGVGPRKVGPQSGVSKSVVSIQVRRDLLLVLRRFSQAVPLAIGSWLLLDAAVWTALTDDRLPELWRQRLAVAGLTLSVLTVVALVPFLLKFQLPRFWIEKSIGVDLEWVWQAKLWTAAVLAAVPTFTGILILLAAPLDATARGMAILQLLAAAWVVTSILALAVFEIAAQPLLGLLFGAFLGLALAALFVFYPRAWWLWAVLYGYAASQIAGRATRRVRLLEAER